MGVLTYTLVFGKKWIMGSSHKYGKRYQSNMEDSYGSVTSDGKYFIFHRVKLGETFEEGYANIFLG